ncbi:MAG: BlaI/MecI/CopY family transcriptional regulator [Acidobacteriota bacterium]
MARRDLPELSRFELQCLRMLWERGEATVRRIHGAMEDPPTYSTVRKIFERLEDKGAIERVGKEGRAVVYRSRVSRPAMVRKEVEQFLDTLFDGAAAPLLSHLARTRAVDLDDLREMERQLAEEERDGGAADADPGEAGERDR